MSLLTTTAGRVLRISPPIAGSKATHHTSPRCGGLSLLVGDIAGQVLDPFVGLALARLVGRHRAITLDEVAPGDVRARQIVEETADPPRPNNAAQPLVNLVFDRDCQLFRHPRGLPVHVSYTYSRPVVEGTRMGLASV